MTAEGARSKGIAMIPGVAALLAHGLSLRNGFALDDDTLIILNPYVRTLEGLGTMLRSSLFVTSSNPMQTDYYRPCAQLLNWLSWQLVGDSRVGQHLINVVMHAAIALLLASILRRYRVAPKVAAMAATIFAVHPATVELVAYVGGRQDMLGWLFVLGAWRLMLDREGPVLGVLSALAMILATFSREAFLAVVVLLPVALAFRPDDDHENPERRRAAIAAGGVAAGFAVVSLARMLVGVAWSQPRDPRPVGDWITTAAGMLLRPLENAVAPTDLAVELIPYELPTIAAALLLLVAAASLLATYRFRTPDEVDRRGVLLFGHLGLLALTAVHTPVALIFGHISDRYTYPFLVCLTLLVAPLAARGAELAAKQLEESPLLPILGALPWLLAVALLPMTLSRVLVWHDELLLQKQLYLDRPHDPMSKYAEARRLMAIGDCENALPLCLDYIDRFPKARRADICLGQCYLALGKPELAMAPLTRYVQRHPSHVEPRQALFGALFHLGRLDEVDALLQALGPAFAEAPDVAAARKELTYLRTPK